MEIMVEAVPKEGENFPKFEKNNDRLLAWNIRADNTLVPVPSPTSQSSLLSFQKHRTAVSFRDQKLPISG